MKKPIKKVTKKVVKKTVSKKVRPKISVPVKPIEERDKILMSSDIFHSLLKHRSHIQGRAQVFLLGEDHRQIITEIVPVEHREHESGCYEMPDLSTGSLVKGYVILAKKGLLPVGIARTGDEFSYDGEWYGDSGHAIYQNIGCILTVHPTGIVGEVFVPKIKDFKERKLAASKSYKKFYEGIIKKLEVGITDK